MNTRDDELGRLLGEQLHGRVDDLHASPLSFEDVRGRARRIRRGRTALAVAGVAAGVGAILPVGLLAGGVLDRQDRPPVVDTPAPEPVPAPTPKDARPGGSGLDVEGLAPGAAPRVGYLDRSAGDVVLPSGTRVALDVEHEPRAYTSLADGRFVVETVEDGDSFVEVVDSDGASTSVHPLSGGVAPDEARTQVAWATPRGAVLVLRAGAAGPRAFGTLDGPSPRVVALNGGDCFEEVLPGGYGGCIVHADVTRTDGTGVGWVLSTTGADDPAHQGGGAGDPDDPALLSVSDFAEGGSDPQAADFYQMPAGTTEMDVDGTCSGVYGPTPELVTDWLLRTCDHSLGQFSPDDERILAWEAYGDGAGHHRIGVYDVRSGELLWDRGREEQSMAIVNTAVWESGTDLIGPAYQDGEWWMVRFVDGGGMETALGPADGDESTPPFVPEIQP